MKTKIYGTADQAGPASDMCPPLAHSDAITVLAFTPDGKYIVSASEDTTVKIWDAQTGVLRHTLFALEGGKALAINISPDSKILAAAYGPGEWHCDEDTKYCPCGILLWNIETGALIRTLKGFRYGINAITFNSDGTQLL
jgi:WD40 repeat protein